MGHAHPGGIMLGGGASCHIPLWFTRRQGMMPRVTRRYGMMPWGIRGWCILGYPIEWHTQDGPL